MHFFLKILKAYDRFAYRIGDFLFKLPKKCFYFKSPLRVAKVFSKYTLITLMSLSVLLTLTPLLPLPGNYQTLVIMSGSMAPAIHVGSLGVIKPHKKYAIGDIITFARPNDAQVLVTHRIFSAAERNGGKIYTTKGDTNYSPDPWEATCAAIKGKLQFSIPYLGYFVHFSKTPRGLLLLIVLPATLIIIDELKIIKEEVERMLEKKYAKRT